MQAQGGYLEYPPGSTKEQLFGVVMQYQEKYYVPYFGIGTGFVSGKKYSMSVFFSYSPIASCSTVDRHFLRDIEFYDKIKNITYLEMGLSVDYRLTDRVVFKITSSYAFIPLSRGDDYYIQTDTGRKSNTFRNISGIKTSFGKVEFSTSTELL